MNTNRFAYTHATGSLLISSGRTLFHGFTINNIATTGTLIIYDSITAAGNVVAGPMNLPSGSAAFPSTILYDAYCNTGLYFNFSGFVGDVTVTWNLIA
jgi:hypothetical protein